MAGKSHIETDNDPVIDVFSIYIVFLKPRIASKYLSSILAVSFHLKCFLGEWHGTTTIKSKVLHLISSGIGDPFKRVVVSTGGPADSEQTHPVSGGRLQLVVKIIRYLECLPRRVALLDTDEGDVVSVQSSHC